jgi:hypothetical protein
MDSEKPKGFNDRERLEVGQQQAPRVKIDRLLSKTGPVAQTITDFCDKQGFGADSPQRFILELEGAVVAAMGRRASRKFPGSQPQELIDFEWESAYRAYNFVLDVLKTLGEVDDYFTQAGKKIKPDWKETNSPGLETLNDYSFLEHRLALMVVMIGEAGYKYGVEDGAKQELADEIVRKHYPKLPEYDEKRFPLAYEVRVLNLLRFLNTGLFDNRIQSDQSGIV